MRSAGSLAFLATVLLVSACAAPGGGDDTVLLSDSTDEGKADSLSGKRLDPIGTEDVEVKPGESYDGQIDVRTVGDVVLEVEGPRLIVPAGVNRRIRVGVDTTGFDLFTELKFLAFVRQAGASEWQPIELEGTFTSLFGGERAITINFFDWLELDAASEEMTFEALGDAVTVDLADARGVDLEYAFFVFPKSGWGSLDGTYDFELTVE